MEGLPVRRYGSPVSDHNVLFLWIGMNWDFMSHSTVKVIRQLSVFMVKKGPSCPSECYFMNHWPSVSQLDRFLNLRQEAVLIALYWLVTGTLVHNPVKIKLSCLNYSVRILVRKYSRCMCNASLSCTNFAL